MPQTALLGIVQDLAQQRMILHASQRVRAAIPDSTLVESACFYIELFGFRAAIDKGWSLAIAVPDIPEAQVSPAKGTPSAVSVISNHDRSTDVENVYKKAVGQGGVTT